MHFMLENARSPKTLIGVVASIVLATLPSALWAGPSSTEGTAVSLLSRSAVLRDMALTGGEICKIIAPTHARQPVEVVVPVNGELVTLRLAAHSVFSDDARILTVGPGGVERASTVDEVTTMRGDVSELPGASVAASVDETGFRAMVLLPDGSVRWIEPLKERVEGAGTDDFIVYRPEDSQCDGGLCGVDESLVREVIGASVNPVVNCGGICIAQLAIDSDYEYYTFYGASTLARITSVINAANVRYQNELSLSFQVTQIVVRATPDDPYPDTINGGNALSAFREYWNANYTSVPRSSALLFTGKYLGPALAGLAAVATSCDVESAYCLVGGVFNGQSLACSSNITAHELGHVWGVFNHCDCPNSTMNATNTCATTFLNNPDAANNSAATISARIATSACIFPQESGTTSIPFSDTFPGPSVNSQLWTGNSGAFITSSSIAPPSAPKVLELRGGATVRSAFVNANYLTDIRASFFVERGGAGSPPGAGEDLVFEWLGADGVWHEANRQAGTGASASSFTAVDLVLPAAAGHSTLRMRFRNLGNDPVRDSWFVDNFAVTGTPLPVGQVSLLRPANGANPLDVKPSFAWTNAANATGYRLTVDNAPDFATPLSDLQVGLVNNYEWAGAPLPLAATLYWRVSAANPASSSVSETRSFSTIAGAPGPFAMTAPPNGTVTDARTIQLAWQPAANAVSYDLEVSLSESFSPSVFHITATVPAPAGDAGVDLTPLPLFLDQPVYTRVIAKNSLGQSVTPTRTFYRIPPPIPGTPVLVQPLDGAFMPLGAVFFLQWSPDPAAYSYRVQISECSDFQSLVLDGETYNPGLLTSFPLFAYPATFHKFWRVFAVNTSGTSAPVCGGGNFYSALAPQPVMPTGFGLISPPDQTNLTTCGSASSLLTWTQPAGPASVTNYRLQIDDDPTFASPEFDRGGIVSRQSNVDFASIYGLGPNTVFWRVIANKADGAQIATAPFSFGWATALPGGSSQPGQFSLLTPLDHAVVGNTPFAVAWTPSTNATSYRVLIVPRDGRPSIALSGQRGTSIIVTAESIGGSGEYDLQVVARGRSGAVATSDKRSFAVFEPDANGDDQDDASNGMQGSDSFGQSGLDTLITTLRRTFRDVAVCAGNDQNGDGRVDLSDLVAALRTIQASQSQ